MKRRRAQSDLDGGFVPRQWRTGSYEDKPLYWLGFRSIIELVFDTTTRARELSDSELAAVVLAKSEQIDRLRAEQIALVAEFDARMVYASDGAVNTAVWLAPRAKITKAEAHHLVHLGRRLRRMPATAQAVESGELSTSQARVLSRVVNDRTAEVFTEHEPELIECAARLTVDQLVRVVRVWEAQADTDGPDPAQRLHDRRKAYLSTGWDGMGHLDADLDPEATAIVSTVLETIAGQLWRSEHPDETAEPPRTTGQRRADALVEMARRASGAHDHSPAAQPLVMVVADLDALRGVGGQADIYGAGVTGSGGEPISMETLRRYACDCTLSRVILGPDREIIDVGRASRVATPAQRRALLIRDGGCVFPGCDRPPGWCQAHHVLHWIDHGPTDLDNLALLCSHHHHLCHEGGWTMQHATGPPGRFEFRRPDESILAAEPARAGGWHFPPVAS